MANAYPTANVRRPGPRCLACASCCVVWGMGGFLFLSFIGQLLVRQPLYVLGVDEPKIAAKQCFGAAWAYFSIVIVSILTLMYDRSLGKMPEQAMDDYEGSALLSEAAAERAERRRSRGQGRLEIPTEPYRDDPGPTGGEVELQQVNLL
mmetsp:Transcript_25038/g.75169  ORF Transcript_25038/g.75169 Transcript_25038/m.75169 type:complete len:149 (+) Transcript_25038:239-685(+)